MTGGPGLEGYAATGRIAVHMGPFRSRGEADLYWRGPVHAAAGFRLTQRFPIRLIPKRSGATGSAVAGADLQFYGQVSTGAIVFDC